MPLRRTAYCFSHITLADFFQPATLPLRRAAIITISLYAAIFAIIFGYAITP
jgi:hypothetical protein